MALVKWIMSRTVTRLPRRSGVLPDFTAALVALLSFGPFGWAADDPEHVSLDTARMDAYLNAEAAKLRDEAWQRIDSKEKLESQRAQLHKEFLYMIGLDPLPPRSDLQATLVRTVDREEFTIEVLHFQSLPRFYVTANLYKPKNGVAPFPAVVCGPGHDVCNFGGKAVRQDYAIPWVRNGYIALVIDPIQMAEVFGVHRGTHAWSHMDWYCRGYTPMGIEVWNAMRGIDYLLSRGDVDETRLTINGCSGGGHLSWMAGVADPRIDVVQPVAGAADVFTHITRNLQERHCDCAYFINIFRHDWATLAAQICPRPLLIHNTTEDDYYPRSGYLAVAKRAREAFEWYGKQEATAVFEAPGRHTYWPVEQEKAVEFSEKWLNGSTREIRLSPFVETPYDQLAALGGKLAHHPPNINDQIQERLIPAAPLKEFDSAAQWQEKRAEILNNLKLYVFRNMPSWRRDAPRPEGYSSHYSIETDPGIRVGMMSYVPKGPPKPLAIYIASEGDTEVSSMWDMMKSYPFEGYAATVHVMYPRGIGSNVWDVKLTRKYQRLSMLLGRSLDDMRLFDVLSAVDHLAKHPAFDGKEITIVGKGAMGVLGAYAALLDDRITRVVLHSPPLTHRSAPILLNVLRYTDAPQVLAMLAPRCELVFLTHEIEHFAYSKDIYALCGAVEKFRRCQTVAQALNLPP